LDKAKDPSVPKKSDKSGTKSSALPIKVKEIKRVAETKEQREKRLNGWKQAETAQIEQYNRNKQEDPNKPLSVIFSGHVDHGKSSMSGHILVNLGKFDERQVQKLK
jgi:peptide chain release factor subunit 3